MERTRRHEQGQAVTAVAITAVLVLVGAALSIVYSFGRVSSEASKIQSGADAAALAGAQQVREEAHGKIISSLHSHHSHWSCGDGQGRASSFAARNDTRIVRYCYYPLADRVEVTVRSDFVTKTGQQEEATAVAETGRRLDGCVVVEIPGSTVGYETTADCGDIEVRVFVDTSGNATLISPPGHIKDEFEVTLRE
ncbi:pilus assembly protein TadG-related protein [Phycicoccus flavus]|uniref:pilus assembly protein TadG-related protein n=1 Tax=Phycicoccus flavus TaxID=2502783 RepID=UPI000FEB7356|nr:pilus assembly protein TadG-related protein [Phycicoccus flavus]NHA69455.1 hypothetical protein [Phycicoccus flavus]